MHHITTLKKAEYETIKTRVHFPPSFNAVEREWMVEQLVEMFKEDVAIVFNLVIDSRAP
jgi:hypothetical protein